MLLSRVRLSTKGETVKTATCLVPLGAGPCLIANKLCLGNRKELMTPMCTQYGTNRRRGVCLCLSWRALAVLMQAHRACRQCTSQCAATLPAHCRRATPWSGSAKKCQPSPSRSFLSRRRRLRGTTQEGSRGWRGWGQIRIRRGMPEPRGTVRGSCVAHGEASDLAHITIFGPCLNMFMQ